MPPNHVARSRAKELPPMSDDVTSFRIDIPDDDLDDLRDRLRRTRWPEAETVDDWSQGVPLAYVRELCEYWADGYDWRATEARLNALPQFRTTIDGLGIHFIHARSPHADALPLVITHGWPGSIVEFVKVIGPLTDPTAQGGAASDAFHVVCPSLPGYGFSDKPARPGWNVQRIAGAWAVLMSRLGYDRYGAQGGDWGTSITTSLGQQDASHLAGIHLTPPIAAPDPATFGDLTSAEQAALAALEHAATHESGYSEQQATKPQTVGYGHVENVLTRDEMLDDVMLYWLPRTGASSARLYWESIRQVSEWFTRATDDTVDVPTGCSIFPKENPRPSRRWAAKRYTDIRYWNELDKGGHFAAFERPELFVDEVRAFFRLVR